MSFKGVDFNQMQDHKALSSKMKKNDEVVDRFLRILWRREVDMKLTFK